MTIRKLQPFPVSNPAKVKTSPSTTTAWLTLADLVIDERYQRPITKSGTKTIEKIVQQFDWNKFTPLIVTKIGPNQHAIIDGQHRATAALIVGAVRVPCYVIAVEDEKDAARIFAAINGTVTPMSPQAVFKAALTGGEEWATEIHKACTEAGVTLLHYPVAKKDQKPLQTMAAGTLRRIHAIHGPAVIAAGLRALAASKTGRNPGFLTDKLIRIYTSIVASRKGWVDAIDAVERAIAPMDLLLAMPEEVEARLVKAIGDGRTAGEAWSTIRTKVQDMRSRRMSPMMIAASLRISYADVERALKEAEAA